MSTTDQTETPAPTLAPGPARPGLRAGWAALRGTGVTLIVGILLLGGLFHTEVTTAIYTWIDSTAYNHCFLVVPIVAYLIWDRRGTLRNQTAQPMPIAVLAGVPLVFAWLAAERLGIMEGRQLIAVAFLEVLFLVMFGWRLWWALSGPLLYLFFAVPFGEFLVPRLQDITTVFVRHGLEIVGIPAYIDGYIIEIPEGTFLIAQACAGLRFLIAAIAFGGLYALLMYRSPVRRAAFIAISIIVPIIANGFRALGIVSLGHILGSAEAAAADHILYGWIFFSIVILLLLACGLPFREDHQPDVVTVSAPPPPGSRSTAGAFACVELLLIAAISPAAAGWLDRTAEQTLVQPKALDFGPGCTSLPGQPPVRNRPATGGRATDQHVSCGGVPLDVHIVAFSPRNTAGPIIAERRRMTHPPDAEETDERGLEPGARGWRLVTGTEEPFVMALSVWVDGEPSPIGLAMRTHLAWTSLTGARSAPMLVTITPAIDWAHAPRSAQPLMATELAGFLGAHPDLASQIQKLAESADSVR